MFCNPTLNHNSTKTTSSSFRKTLQKCGQLSSTKLAFVELFKGVSYFVGLFYLKSLYALMHQQAAFPINLQGSVLTRKEEK